MKRTRLRDLAKQIGSGVPSKPKLIKVDSTLFVPAAGFTQDYGEFSLIGPELVCRYFTLKREASVEVVTDTPIHVGVFQAPFKATVTNDWWSDPNGGGGSFIKTGTGNYCHGEWSYSAPGGELAFRPHEALVAEANQYFQLHDLRFILDDPVAAYAAYKEM